MKRLPQHASDPYMALLSFRTTPLPWYMLSPVELLFGWKIITDLPQTDHYLTLNGHTWTNLGRQTRNTKTSSNLSTTVDIG